MDSLSLICSNAGPRALLALLISIKPNPFADTPPPHPSLPVGLDAAALAASADPHMCLQEISECELLEGKGDLIH